MDGRLEAGNEIDVGSSELPTARPRVLRARRTLTAIVVSLVLAGSAWGGDLRDPTLSPGDVLTTNASGLCTPEYARSVRLVTDSVKHRVYIEYGIAEHRSGEFEVDHLISLLPEFQVSVVERGPSIQAVPAGRHHIGYNIRGSIARQRTRAQLRERS